MEVVGSNVQNGNFINLLLALNIIDKAILDISLMEHKQSTI